MAELSSSIRLDPSYERRDPKLPVAPPYNPAEATTSVLYAPTVWALPLSLAATGGIEVSFSSSGY